MKRVVFCNWLFANGNEEDFSNFIDVFKVIEDTLISI